MCTFFLEIYMNNYEKYFTILYNLAKKSFKKNEVPVSAIILNNGRIIARAYNKKNIKQNALFHAEILCIYKACKKLKTWNLNGCEMYVTLEPCDMCKNAIQEARISEVKYFLSKGAITNKYSKTKYEHLFVRNIDEYEMMLKTFFKGMRK